MSSTRFTLAAVLTVLAAGFLSSDATGCDDTEDLAARRKAIAAKGLDKAAEASERYALGVWAQSKGLDRAARAEFETAIGLDADHAEARKALGFTRRGDAWLTHAEAMKEKGLVYHDGAWLLPEEKRILTLPEAERARRRTEHAKVDKLLKTYGASQGRVRKYALESLGTIDDEYKMEPMAFALRAKSKDIRLLAAKELGRLKSRRALRPLLYRSLYDTDEEVRFAAIGAAKSIGDANLLAPLVTALNSDSQTMRTNAASAMGALGDVRGVSYLVYRYEAHGGGAPRVYITNIKQLTFIQDFDVEVAQTAFIADPIVGVIQEGHVLDMQVVATSETGYMIERQTIHGALQKLTGATDVPDKAGAWAKWFKANKADLVAKAAK